VHHYLKEQDKLEQLHTSSNSTSNTTRIDILPLRYIWESSRSCASFFFILMEQFALFCGGGKCERIAIGTFKQV
jgi:hypothetical protein